MIKKVFYNSSLPRAGSTLIQNILAQNPEIYSTPTSAVYEILLACRTVYSDAHGFKAQDKNEMESGFKSLLKSALYGFYEPITDKPYVIDKCRGWSYDYDFVNEFDPNPKMICMIRDLRGIYASMEKKFRKNPLLDHHLDNWNVLEGTTTDKRILAWAVNPPIGPAVDRLYQVLLQGIHKNILFIKFEELCSDPELQLKRIYDYLELPYYKHDFNNVKQLTHEDDKIHGVYGDHKIRNKVQPVKEDWKEVLGPIACQMIIDKYPWFYNDFGYKI